MKDSRYTITQEYCGHAEQQFVARFCGEWIASASDRKVLDFHMAIHANRRGFDCKGYRVLANESAVMLVQLPNNTGLRVVYGASVSEYDFDDKAGALHEYADCLLHHLECEGKFD